MHLSRTRTVAALAAVPLLLTCAACSDDAGNEPAASTTGAARTTPAVSPSPGGATVSEIPGRGNSPSASASSPGRAGKGLTAAQLRAALVTTSDLPSGWRAGPPETEDDSSSTADKAACQPILDMINGTGTGTAASGPRVSAELTAPGASEARTQVLLASYEATANKLLTDVKAALPSCATFRAEFLTYTIAPARGPALGDDSVSFVVSSSIADVTLTTTRVGNVLVNAAQLGGDTAVPEPVLRAQVDKVAAAQRG